ncbi:MAG: hypothetical protein LUH21_04185 [Clostridiales bacterium]|nr:hypothetical protein [Clostridiales bacterium]
MKDSYKCGLIKDNLVNMARDEYYRARVVGASTKSFNLDENALMLLHAYYSGEITEQEIQERYDISENK